MKQPTLSLRNVSTFIALTLLQSPQALAGQILELKSVGRVQIQDESLLSQKRSAFAHDGSIHTFVIQFKSTIASSDQAQLKALGLEVQNYLPEDAVIVRGSTEALTELRAISDSVRAIHDFAPEWKISPELMALAPGSRILLLISTLRDGSTLDAAHLLQRIPGVQLITSRGRNWVAEASTSALSQIAEIDTVEWIETAPQIQSLDFGITSEDLPAPQQGEKPAVTGFESGTRIMGFEKAWARGFHAEGQRIAVADTGLDSGKIETIHPDFKDTLYKGYNSGLGTESWEDPMGHGTHVAGSVVGTGAASEGNFKGGSHRGQLLFQGLWSSIFDNLAPGTDFNTLISPAYDDGARIHSNSWGSARTHGEYDTMAANVDEYIWNHPDLLILFAAGNSGEDKNRDGRIDENSTGSPATAKNVLTVGASENYLLSGGIQKKARDMKNGKDKWGVEPLASSVLSDNPNGIAIFSSRGPTEDGRLKPEVVAPGTNIVSTRSHHPKASPLWGIYNENYLYAGGTSMATPLTAGAAGVVRQYLVEQKKIPNPSAALMKAVLMHSADDLFPGQYGEGVGQELQTARPNVHEGYGRVNVDTATALPEDTRLIDEATGVAVNEVKVVMVKVPEGGSLRATLSYSDAPAAAAASRSLVNDLDLVIGGPNRNVFEKKDRLNNTEMLELTHLSAGNYAVSVRGVNVPRGKAGKQPYALVITTQ